MLKTVKRKMEEREEKNVEVEVIAN